MKFNVAANQYSSHQFQARCKAASWAAKLVVDQAPCAHSPWFMEFSCAMCAG